VVDVFDMPGAGRIAASCVDAANACVFVRAAGLGLVGIEAPQALEADRALMDRLLALRAQASVAMAIARDPETARAKVTTPPIGIVAPPATRTTLAGDAPPADGFDLAVRMISSDPLHRAQPPTAAVCIAVAAQIEGTLVHAAIRRGTRQGADADALRLGMPSGVLTRWRPRSSAVTARGTRCAARSTGPRGGCSRGRSTVDLAQQACGPVPDR
jgi:hypothetical protein